MRRREFLRCSAGMLAMAVPLEAEVFGATLSTATRRVLYVLGQFQGASPAQMEALRKSRFNVLILSFLEGGFAAGKLTLSYNGNAISSLAPGLPARLRAGFSERKRILLSIGGWQHLRTFEAIRSAGIRAFVRQLTEQVVQPLGLEGIDLDLEPETGGLDHWRAAHAEYGQLLAELTNEYKRVHPGHVVTHAPLSILAAELYAQPAPLPGLPGGLLHATRTAHGNSIDWLNVQFYEGGLVPNGDIAGFYCESLVEPLKRLRRQSGVADPLQFLLPLFQPQAAQPLKFCQGTMKAIGARCGDLPGGVALWDYRQIQAALPVWSAGLNDALEGATARR